MPRGVLMPARGGSEIRAFGERAEALGYDAVWVGELWGRDALVQLGVLAEATDEVTLGTAIVNVFSRTPAVLASAVRTLDELAPGRIRLGVGTSTPRAIENVHGRSFDRPVRRVHETVELVRRLTGGDGAVTYEGETVSASHVPAVDADAEVFVAALGDANRRATGRVADGWIPHMIPFDHLDDAFETVAETARERGRDPAAVTVSPHTPCAVADDADVARETARGHVAYYVGSGEGYRRAVARAFPEEADAIAAAWADGDRGLARERVTEEMVDALTVAGTPDEARERLAALESRDVVDEPIVVVPANADETVEERTISELAPSRRTAGGDV